MFGLRSTVLIVLILGIGSIAFGAGEQNVIYVDDEASLGGDGTTWNTAFKHLQDALHQATSGDEIRVAAGRYTPDLDEGGNVTAGDREASFHLITGVALRGGYAGLLEPGNPDHRDIQLFATILSGDLTGNDVAHTSVEKLIDEPTIAENSYQIVIGSGTEVTAVMDGFIVTGGNANGVHPRSRGAGLYNDAGHPTITNCVFAWNASTGGTGGMDNRYSNPTVTDCKFLRNAYRGLSNYYSCPIITNCEFIGNWTPSFGGGIDNWYYSNATITNCTFRANLAGYGGGMSISHVSKPTLTNCRFLGNAATHEGGGIHTLGGDATLINCIFRSNVAGRGGGLSIAANAELRNCTVFGNSALDGGGVFVRADTEPILSNCILWGNSSTQLKNEAQSALVSYSLVQGGWPGTGNIDQDPLLTADAEHLQAGSPCINAGDPTADYTDQSDFDGETRLANGAPDIGADEWIDTDADALPDWWETLFFQSQSAAGLDDDDLDGVLNVDEYAQSRHPHRQPTTFFVNASGDDSWDGLAAEQGAEHGPKATIQAAIDLAHHYERDEIVIADGSYSGAGNRNINTRGKQITVRSANGPDKCIIDCQQQGRGFYFFNGETPATLIEGLTIQNGTAVEGGGAFCHHSSPTLTNCAFVNNTAATYGGGVFQGSFSNSDVTTCTFSGNAAGLDGGGLYGGAATNLTVTDCTFNGNSAEDGAGMFADRGSNAAVTNCTFSENTAFTNGGGMYIRGHLDSQSGVVAESALTDCMFSGNSAGLHGGGLYSYYFISPTVINCTFDDNTAGTNGGGMYNSRFSTPTLMNCSFLRNEAEDGGGLAIGNDCDSVVSNCTFTQNEANDDGGAIYNLTSASAITNSIVWDNSPPQKQIDNGTTGSVSVSHSCVQGGWDGVGNIDIDPMLTPDGKHLQPGSPCIDNGNPGEDYTGQQDIDGEPRVNNCAIDMGVDESSDLGPDCNHNGLSDACDLLELTSVDCDANSVPDECDPDCNTNDIPDACDIADGSSDDCDGNLIPDECSPDCNNNGIADSCDLANGDAADCNRNGVPDECETSTTLLVDDDAPNGGDGLTWGTAFNNLRDARNRALACDLVNEIRIAQGTYTPGVNRQDSFNLLSGVRVSGGYAGLGAPDRNARDIAHYETIITGDIGNPDDPTDNCYRVVAAFSVDETATLDGVTITGGNANGPTSLDTGGGLWITASSPTITNCTIRENSGDFAAGMYIKGGSPTITHTTFVENEAIYFGGGIYLEDTSPSLDDCTFDNNTAALGGGIFNDASSPLLTSCTFFENTASSGAGIYNDADSAPTVIGTTFEGNTGSAGAAMYNIGSPTVMASSFCRNHATYGGAIYNRQNTAMIEHCQFTRNMADGGPIVEGDGGAIFNSNSSPVIRGCGFNENTAVIGGGAVASAGQGGPTITDCTFDENSALIGGAGFSSAGTLQIHRSSFRENNAVATGGAWYNHLTDATMTRCTFTANTAESGGAVLNDNSVAAITSSLFVGNSVTGYGGGIRNIDSGATLTHCTFAHNAALSDGGAIDNTHPTSLSTVTGCIFWSNTPALGQISNQNSGSASVSYSCIQGGWPGLGNIAADPLFAQPGDWNDNKTPLDSSDDFWVDGDYRLMPDSPAINAGDPFYQPAPGETDLDAHPRVLCGRIDLGAYEFGIGDFDCSRSTDLADAAYWPMCMTGPANSSYDAGCEAFDFDSDGDVDLRDAAGFASSVMEP